MGLLGALFAGVSGLDSQSNAIGIISNNISNVNTVGFKQGSASFDTLVVPSGTTSFSPGGVIGNTQQLINQQGLIQATSSSTDIAITGGGLMVVNTSAEGTGNTLYTRAGSFTQDSNGNFINADGYYLQGLPVLASGATAQADTANLETVNVSSNATGTATATSVINMAANLDSQQTILPGSSATGTMLTSNDTSAVNAGISGSTIIAGNDYPGAGISASNNLLRGSTFDVTSGSNAPDVFTYGGYTVGRDVLNADVGDGGNALLTTPQTIAIGNMSVSTDPANTTTSAITGINVSSTSTSATIAGAFAAGTFKIDGATVNVGLTDSLTAIATNIETALPTATATISGSAGDYTITVVDANGTGGGAGFVTTGGALTGNSPTFSLLAPVDSPAADQMQITVGAGNIADYTVGQYLNVTNGTTFGSVNPNGEFKIVSVDATADTVTVNTGQTASGDVDSTSTADVTNRTFDFSGNILNASTAGDDFITSGSSGTTASDFASNALKFSITVGTNSPLTLTYNANPDAANGQFNSLDSLATAISDSSNNTLTATVVDNRLYVSAANANQSVTFTNGDVAGSGGQAGIDWTQELDLQNQTGGTTGVFNTLNGLAQQINTVDPTNLTAAVSNPTAAAAITITEANPEQTITITDGQTGSSVLKELGFANLQTAAGLQTTGALPITYSATSSSTDMSSGAVTPQQSFDVTVYDSQGNAHTLALNLVKTAANIWQAELTAVPASDVSNSATADGQIASGQLTFNGNGILTGVSGSLDAAITADWTGGASPSSINLNLIKNAAANGLTQDDAGYALQTASQNGSPVGQLTGVSIDGQGYVIASFSNGETQKEFQIPLANVSNPDGLDAVTGNAYSVTLESGNATLQIAGTSGVGTFTPSALEESNVDLSTQLTNLIVAQQAYGANSKVLTIADQLLQELDNVIQS